MRARLKLLFAVPAALAALVLWRPFEMDLFWALRAGQEIAKTASIPMTETWSYTVGGSPWLNTHWLTEIFLYAVFAAFGAAGLVVFRAILVFGWLSLVALAARRARGDGWVIPSVVAALAFLTSTYRMELRGEMFVLLAFSAVVLFWTGKERPNRERDSVLAVLVASNFHAGQGVMVLALALAMIIWENRQQPKRIFVFGGAALLAFFATPVHFRAIEFIRAHLLYTSDLTNPDHQPLSEKLFDPIQGGHGLSYWVWLALLLAGALGIYKMARPKAPPRKAKKTPAALPLAGVYKNWATILAVGGVLVWLSIDRVRAVPFSVAFFIPMIARVFPKKFSSGPFAGALLASALGLALLHAKLLPRRYGFQVDDRVFPVHAANFITQQKPAKNLYHTFTFGAYLVWALPEYPLFGDTRETPFKSMTALYKQAYGSPAVTRALHEKYSINTLMMPIPGTERLGDVGYRDVIEEYTPRSEWALVYFDDISLILSRRVPENAKIIEDKEYKNLRPNIPPAFFAAMAKKLPDKRAALKSELEKCLKNEAPVAWCAALEEML